MQNSIKGTVFENLEPKGKPFQLNEYITKVRFPLRIKWTMANSKIILVREMTDNHMINTINMLERIGRQGHEYKVLVKEAYRRRLITKEDKKLRLNMNKGAVYSKACVANASRGASGSRLFFNGLYYETKPEVLLNTCPDELYNESD